MNTKEDNFPIFREEVEAAVDNIAAKLIQTGGEAVTNIFTAICNKIWQTGEVYSMDPINGHHTSKNTSLWETMRKYNIGVNLVRAIEHPYDKATSAVLINGTLGEWFRTTIGVCQGFLLSPTLFNIFSERIMTDALEDHVGTVNIRGRTIKKLRFADDMDGLEGVE